MEDVNNERSGTVRATSYGYIIVDDVTGQPYATDTGLGEGEKVWFTAVDGAVYEDGWRRREPSE